MEYLSEDERNRVLNKLKSKHHNKTCADCGTKWP